MILVIGNYRTGSSTFLSDLSEQTGLSYWNMYTGEWCHSHAGGYRPPSPDIGIYKIFPDQALEDDLVKDYINPAEKVYYTLRRDVRSQINSLIYSAHTGYWHDNDYARDLCVTVNRKTIAQCAKAILTNLKKQKQYYKKYGGELIFLEDRFDAAVKYTKPHLEIPDYDLPFENAEEYFNE